MTLRMTLSQGSLEDLHGLTLLGGADVAVDLHRGLARRVAEQLVSDPRMDTRAYQQAGRAMAEVVEPHLRQARALQERLEVLGQPRPVDRVAPLSDDHQAVGWSFVGPLLLLALQVGTLSRLHIRSRTHRHARSSDYRRVAFHRYRR